jgi:hypothetical protein
LNKFDAVADTNSGGDKKWTTTETTTSITWTILKTETCGMLRTTEICAILKTIRTEICVIPTTMI